MRLISTGMICAALLIGGMVAPRAEDGTVLIGAAYNDSGDQAVLDQPSLKGARLAANVINNAGGVGGTALSLVVADGDSVPDNWPRAIDALLAENSGMVGIVGLSDTDNVRAAATAAAARERVFLTSGATSPQLPAEVPTYLFLACFGDNVQAAAGAEWAYHTLQARAVHVLFDPNETYPVLLKDYFIERFTELGGAVPRKHEVDPRSASPSVPEIGNPDLLFLSVETAQDAMRLIPLIRQSGYSGPILGGDGYDAPAVWSAHPDVAEVYFTTHVYLGSDNPNPTVRAFLAAYQGVYRGEAPTGFSALGYDAVGLVAEALTRSGEMTPAGLLAGLPQIEDYQGVTGTIGFADGSRIPKKSVTLVKVGDGVQRFQAQIMPDAVPAP